MILHKDVEGLGRTVGVLSDSLVVGAERVDDAASAVVALVGRQLRLLGRDDSLARAGTLRTLARRPPRGGRRVLGRELGDGLGLGLGTSLSGRRLAFAGAGGGLGGRGRPRRLGGRRLGSRGLGR